MVGYGCRGEPILNHEMNSEIAGKKPGYGCKLTVQIHIDSNGCGMPFANHAVERAGT
jgi:hypothetical protein